MYTIYLYKQIISIYRFGRKKGDYMHILKCETVDIYLNFELMAREIKTS